MSRRVLALVALLAASSALAQEYRRTGVPGKPLCLAWNQREYVYRYDSAGSARTPDGSEFAAMEAAFDTWRALSASCSDYVFTRGPDLSSPPRVGYVQASEENRNPVNENAVFFREDSCDDVVGPDDPCHLSESCGNDHGCWEYGREVIGLMTATFSKRTGHILDADIELNASQPGGSPGFLFTTVDSPPCEGPPSTACVAVDLQNTLTHEIGHVVGLDHVFTPGSLMEASAPPGETRKRIIDEGSAEGFCSTYPRGLPPTQCFEPAEQGLTLTAEGRLGCASAPASLLPAALLSAWALRSRRQRAGRRAR